MKTFTFVGLFDGDDWPFIYNLEDGDYTNVFTDDTNIPNKHMSILFHKEYGGMEHARRIVEKITK